MSPTSQRPFCQWPYRGPAYPPPDVETVTVLPVIGGPRYSGWESIAWGQGMSKLRVAAYDNYEGRAAPNPSLMQVRDSYK